MYQIAEAARRLNLSRVWVYELIARGALVTSTVGGVRFVVADDRFKAIQRKRSGPKAADAGLELRREVWTAYSNAYQDRYGVPPETSAEARSAIKRYCGKVRAAECAAVAAYYVTHQSAFYVAKGHNLNHLATDAAKLRTEWATGKQITQTQAMQTDKSASRGNVFKELIQETKNGKS